MEKLSRRGVSGKRIVYIHTEDLADIYLTGSNGRIFSAELATLLGGRYIQIPVFPLTLASFWNSEKSFVSWIMILMILWNSAACPAFTIEIGNGKLFMNILTLFSIRLC